MDFSKLNIREIVKCIKNKDFSAVEITQHYLDQIKNKDPKIKAFITVSEREALKQAEAIDKKISTKEKTGRLAGVPYALKDNYLTQGIETTSGSKVLKGYIPQYSAEMYVRLKNEDSILLGKTNLDTFAFGSSTENSGFFTTHNPYDLKRVSGGSSGGSAAAVASDMVVFALGSDTGGSIRQPSSFCGVVGMKPTYGRNSRYGITAMASSFDCPGAITKTVEDNAFIEEILAGIDNKDSTTSDKSVPNYSAKLDDFDISKITIGLPKEFFGKGANTEVLNAVNMVVDWYKKRGASVKEISLPHSKYALSTYYLIVPSEISANMARYDGLRFGQSVNEYLDINSFFRKTRGKYMEPELKRRIIIGTYALSAGFYDAYYKKASQVRTIIRNEFIKVFKEVDVIIAPTTPTTAFKIGEKSEDPLQMYLADIFTVPVNVAGIPSINIPTAYDGNGLPIGMQIMGNFFEENKIYKTAYYYNKSFLLKNTR